MHQDHTKKTTGTDLDEVASRHYTAHANDPALQVENIAHSELAVVLTRYLVSSNTILDLGYGTGQKAQHFSRHFADETHQLAIVEGSPQVAERARREMPPSVEIHESLFEQFSPARKCDAVVASHVLEHVDDPVAILRRSRDWLRDSGQLIVVVPNAESIHRQIAARIGIQQHMSDFSPTDIRVEHRRIYNLVMLQQDIVEAGFQVEHVFGHFLKTVSNGMLSNLPPNVVRGLCSISDLMPPNLLANIGVVAKPVVATS